MYMLYVEEEEEEEEEERDWVYTLFIDDVVYL